MSLAHYMVILLVVLVKTSLGELRWCEVTNGSLSPAGDNWFQYDDENLVCVKCSNYSVVLIKIENMDLYECCNGLLTSSGTCISQAKESGNNCSNTIKCNGIKQCFEGLDEAGCTECQDSTLFSCNDNMPFVGAERTTCLPIEKVCDSQKDCRFGLDETGCRWHRGWCQEFLCGKPNERCIPKSQVCDGYKHCIDGSDEFNCQFCSNQFRCMVIERNSSNVSPRNTRTAQCIGKQRLCDGTSDCDNNLDEKNCYRWREWSSWSNCTSSQNCRRRRTRACITGRSLRVVDAIFCNDVDDYHATIPPVSEPDVEYQMNKSSTITPLETTVTLLTISEETPTTPLSPTIPSSTTPKSTVTSLVRITLTSLLTKANSTLVTLEDFQNTRQPDEKINISTAFSQLSSGTTELTSAIANSEEASPNQASSTAFALIIVAVAVAVIIIIIILCCLIFCFTNRRHKRGKWTPKRFRNDRPIKVPKMYNDVPMDSARNFDNILPTSQSSNPKL